MSQSEAAEGRHEPASGREPATVPPVGLSARLRQVARLIGAGRLAVLVGCCAGLLVAATLGWQSVHQTGRASDRTEAGPPQQGETAAVMQLLGRHAGELLARDRAGWSADLDDAAAAADYRGRQQAVFGNLAEVPLAAWRYVLIAPVTDPAVLAPAATRLGGRVVMVHVDLQYALAVVDPAPTAHGLWLTAVRRAGGWRLASDTDAATAGGPSWQGLWDFGPLIARAGPHTLVLAHPAHAAEVGTFAGLVERSVPVVSRVWGRDWNDHVAVLIPDTAAEFDAVIGSAATSDETAIAAVAVADSISGGPSGGGGAVTVLGARIVLNPDNLNRLDPAGRRLVVQHELTHIATRADTSDQMPAWLIEGFADYVGNLDSGQPVPVAARELAAEVRRGMVPSALPGSADFAGTNSRLAQAYEESWLACRLVARTYGQPALVRLYRRVALAAGSNPATAAAIGLRDVLKLTPAAFTSAWRADLVRELAR